jgi:predicted small secreted protein
MKKTSPRRIILLLLTTAFAALFSSSCRGTINGVGHDVERAGHNIHKSVN